MLSKLTRAIAVPVPRLDLLRALALCGPLALLLVADKAIKLSSAVAADIRRGMSTIVWQSFLQPAIGSTLVVLILEVFIVGGLLALLMHRRARSWLGWSIGILLVYGAMAVGALLHGEAHPLLPFALSQAAEDAGSLIDLWWRDAAALTLLAGLIAWHLARRIEGERHLIRGGLIWSLLALACIVTALDTALFVATGTGLNASDLYFALSSPDQAWIVSRGALSIQATAVLSEILLCALVCSVMALLFLRRHTNGLSGAQPAVRLGLWLWPAFALAVVSPASMHESRARAADDPLLSIPIREAENELALMLALRGTGAPSAIVPALQVSRVTLAPTAASRRWNVVIVMLESARARDTTVYTPSLRTTPFLAQLARESLVVDHMYAVIPRTTDAWIATLAGRYSSSDSTVANWAHHHPPIMASSMPRLLGAEGYTSAFFLPTTLHFDADDEVVRALGFDKVVTKESIPEPPSGLVTPFGWEDRALLPPIGRWLDQRASDKRPFLLAVMTNVGHTPYGLPPGFHTQRFPSLNDKHERYLNCMYYIDGYVRDLVQELRDRGLYDNTVLIVLGDHGEAFGEHGTFFRGDGMYEELLQIPMLIHLPSSAARTGHIDGLRQQIDILPTVADALGFKLSGAALPGSSLLSDSRGHEALFFEQYWDRRAIALRIGALKYVYYFGNEPADTFDLNSDPNEHRSIASKVSPRSESQAQVDMLAWRDRAAQTFRVSRSSLIGSDAGNLKDFTALATRGSR